MKLTDMVIEEMCTTTEKVRCGFVEFYSKEKEDKEICNFFKEANNRDILGLRKMNVQVSNILFPFGNTLMANLVYIYYLNAIYHVLREKNGKAPAPTEVKEWEEKISRKIVEQIGFQGKGFLGTAKVRAYTRYKSNMTKMHYFKEDWKVDESLKKCALESLKETKRYQFVKTLITTTDKEIGFQGTEVWIDKLENAERLDFIRRVVLPYEENPTKYSVFSNIVMYYCKIKRKPQGNDTIYRDDWLENYDKKRRKELEEEKKRREEEKKSGIAQQEKKTDNSTYNPNKLESFDRLSKYYCNGIIEGKDEQNREEDYRVARLYSKLQRIAKHAYNACLFENDEFQKKKYENSLMDDIRKLKGISNHKENENSEKDVSPISLLFTRDNINKYFKSKRNKEYKLFTGIGPGSTEPDEVLESSFAFIYDIANEIMYNEDNVQLVENIKKIVRDREEKIMGDDSILGSGIRADSPKGDYIDTFRWQYRPEYVYDDAENSGLSPEDAVDAEDDGKNTDSKEELPVWQIGDSDHSNLHIMSASYYIYELFYEPYE